METYKVLTPSGFETEIQAQDEDEVRRYGFVLFPETRSKTPANKARKPETKEA